MTVSASRAAELCRRLVGWRSGIVKAVHQPPPLPGEPRVHAFAGRTCDLSHLGRPPGSTTCGGVGFSPEAALLACLGEAVERYCCQFAPPEMPLHPFDQAGAAAVDPAAWALFSEAQYAAEGFPFAPVGRETPLRWTPATSLTERREKLVPACMVYMPYSPREPEPLVAPATSTGLSCAADAEQAALRGLLEVIERDALAIAWLKRAAVWELCDVPGELLAPFSPGAIDYRVFDLTSDAGAYVYLALSAGPSDYGRLITVGAAAGIDPAAVLTKALLENAQGRLALMAMRRDEPDWAPAEDFSNVMSFHDHARVLTCRADLLDELGFLGARGRRRFPPGAARRFETAAEALAWCVGRLAELGLEVLVKDLTTCDVAPLGLRVVRVLVPGMQPLHGAHGLALLGGGRLARAAEVFGLEPAGVLAPGEYNPIPHPLP